MTWGQVQDSAELRRILALPRRAWGDRAHDLALAMSQALRVPGASHATLRPLQAIALAEIAQWGGAFVPLPVGAGKTLLMLLAPRVRPEVQRPLFLMPASLIGKTEIEAREYRKAWVLPAIYQIRSYEEMGRVGAADFLESYRPELIVADEAHYLKNPEAAVTRRVMRYLDAARPLFVPMTGTPFSTSIRDFAHLCRYALPRTNPLPARWVDLDEWARALDVDVAEHRRLGPGALRLLCADPLEDHRDGFRRRLGDTPGVVLSTEPQLPIPLDLRAHVTPMDGQCLDALTDLRATWTAPDGEPCEDGIAVWRHARELATGFYQVWDPRPPEDWRDARRAWHSECREILGSNRRALDSADQLCRFLDSHPAEYPDGQRTLREWRAIAPTFVPNPVPIWISDSVLHWIAEWVATDPRPPLIWTDRPTVGQRLARLLGAQYYGEGGVSVSSGQPIEAHDPARHGPAVLAMEPNSRGRNLQAWSRNLVVDVTKSARRIEQLIGRTHRPGQLAPRVSVDFAIGVVEDVEALERVRERAERAQVLTGQPQKILYGTHPIPGVPTIDPAPPGPRWTKTAAQSGRGAGRAGARIVLDALDRIR